MPENPSREMALKETMSQVVELVRAFSMKSVPGSRDFLQLGAGDVLSQEVGVFSARECPDCP